MTLVFLIAVIMAFVLGARFLKILDRAVDWLYSLDPEKEDEVEIIDE